MKHFTFNGETTDRLPGILNLPEGQISPVSEATFLAYGGTITEDDEPTHMELMDAACDNFVAVSLDIGTFIGDTDFRGGIDEIDKLYQSEAAQQYPEQALILAARWLAADKALNHWASKDS